MLSLEALRAVNRHGIAGHGEQYTGFARLGPGDSKRPDEMTLEEAADALVPEGWTSHMLIADKDLAKMAADRARKNAHPDAGGSHDRFVKVETARRILLTHHKLAV